MDSGSRAATVGDGAANFSAARLWLGLLNASSPPTRWDGSPPAHAGTGPEEQQRLVREQAYRDFTTAIQVLILIGSLLGKSHRRRLHVPHAGPANYVGKTNNIKLYGDVAYFI